MTIGELFVKIEEFVTSVVLWFYSGIETLINGNWLELTIGQAVLSVFFAYGFALFAYGFALMVWGWVEVLIREWNKHVSVFTTINIVGFVIIIIAIVLIWFKEPQLPLRAGGTDEISNFASEMNAAVEAASQEELRRRAEAEEAEN